MALVDKLEFQSLERDSAHSEVKCTYDIVVNQYGEKCIQLDTYGSKGRKMPGKKSQSLRLSPNAIQELKEIFKNNDM
jgi:hypothetical protein